jgi:hypothetical protein
MLPYLIALTELPKLFLERIIVFFLGGRKQGRQDEQDNGFRYWDGVHIKIVRITLHDDICTVHA